MGSSDQVWQGQKDQGRVVVRIEGIWQVEKKIRGQNMGIILTNNRVALRLHFIQEDSGRVRIVVGPMQLFRPASVYL